MNINKVNIVKGDTEVKINKKLWSLIFGCLIAGSFVWLISFGNSAPAPDFLHSYPHFILRVGLSRISSQLAVSDLGE